LVDVLDAQGHARGDPYTFQAHLGDALEFVYNAATFARGSSPFFEALKASPDHFLLPRPKVREWLILQRRKG
jgi:hypothetical protein